VVLFCTQTLADTAIPADAGGRSTLMEMDNRTFGLTLMIVGMGGTLVALGVLALLMGLLKKLFPATPEKK